MIEWLEGKRVWEMGKKSCRHELVPCTLTELRIFLDGFFLSDFETFGF